MPTPDDAAYKAAYRKSHGELHEWVTPAVQCVLRTHIGRAAIPINALERFSRIDAATDILLERGLCADVRDWWHKKPAGDELEW